MSPVAVVRKKGLFLHQELILFHTYKTQQIHDISTIQDANPHLLACVASSGHL